MSKVDEELTRRLQRAERPMGAEDLFEGLERRRSHRERARRVQAGFLALAVLAATAGGFLFLRHAFDPDKRDVGDELPASVSNGEIVFSDRGKDGYIHLYAVQPDGSGRRQITDFGTNDTDPVVSLDGRTIAFVHQLEDVGPAIATIPVQGGTVTWQSPEGLSAADPSWSPDGTRIAFVGQTSGWSVLHVMRVNSADAQPLTSRLDAHTAEPTWSPDGTRIAFALRGRTGPWGLASIRPDGTRLEPLATPVSDEDAPAWSPDGSRIAFMRPYRGQDGIWTMPATGGKARLVAYAATLEHDLAWAPDGSALLVSDGEWIYRVDATSSGESNTNFVQLVRGRSPAWQPLPAASAPPSPEPEPSPSPSPRAGDADIGLGFNVCNLERLRGIDFLGDGTEGQAWTAARVKENGTCPEPSLGHTYLVAADVDGDGVADASSETVDFCYFCRPFDAVDFDGDGDDELVIKAAEGSTPTFMVYDVRDPGDPPRIEPVLVAEPGHPEAGEQAGEPLTFSTGGDEGFSGWVRCEDFPAAPVLVITWRDHPVESNTMEVHETRFVLEDDGLFHVVGSNDYSAPVGDAIRGVSDAPACGVDWQIFD
jgi:Tol biopolymer transport system component